MCVAGLGDLHQRRRLNGGINVRSDQSNGKQWRNLPNLTTGAVKSTWRIHWTCRTPASFPSGWFLMQRWTSMRTTSPFSLPIDTKRTLKEATPQLKLNSEGLGLNGNPPLSWLLEGRTDCVPFEVDVETGTLHEPIDLLVRLCALLDVDVVRMLPMTRLSWH